jgi:hypothetical protein
MSKTRRGRGGQPQLTVIFWRDIPAQVKARAGGVRASARLPDRFMTSVDAAATKAGKTSDDDYIGEWREESRACGQDLQMEVDREADNIAETYPSDVIKTYIRNGGWAPTGSP